MPVRYVKLQKHGKKGRARKIYLLDAPRSGAKKLRQVLWGDHLTVAGAANADYYEVTWAPLSDDPQTMYIRKTHTTLKRPLEIVFVDVGQGDGAVLVAPESDGEEKVFVIDAGKTDHMARFLQGRFGSYGSGYDFSGALITHTDTDHYLGFKSVFDERKLADDGSDDGPLFTFKTVFHPGLLEGPGGQGVSEWDRLGGREKVNDRNYLTDLLNSGTDVKRRFTATPDVNYDFADVVASIFGNKSNQSFKMLSNRHGSSSGVAGDRRKFVPGLAPKDTKEEYSVQVLAPFVERPNGVDALRTLGSYAETKNGHSVILKLEIGDFSVLFGGDLNDKAEKFMLKELAGLSRWPSVGSAAHTQMIAAGRDLFGADVLKVCHHGSEKVTDEFLRAADAAVFVVSSGETGGHVHPRPELLGRLGKAGRTEQPVILSTELQRSTKADDDPKDVQDALDRVDALASGPTEARIRGLKDRIEKLARTNVGVYGSIYVKTDGTDLIAAFKKETGSQIDKWFYFHYSINDDRSLKLTDTV